MACKKITTPEIAKEQDAIWQKSGIPSEARETLAERSPAGCSVPTAPGHARKKR
jgi:hypothetical protein